jgi:hypothetical protein
LKEEEQMDKRKWLIWTCFLASVTSCSDDFLVRQPIIGVTEENFYKTEADAIAAVNAAYATLQFQISPAGHFRWFWGDIMSDDAIKGGSGDNDVNSLLQLETFKGPVNTDLLESEWGASYEGIYRANVVLEKVAPIAMDEKLKQRILGEARFIRRARQWHRPSSYSPRQGAARPLWYPPHQVRLR